MILKLITILGISLAVMLALVCLGPFFLFGEITSGAQERQAERSRP